MSLPSHPSKLPWSEVRVWIEDPAMRSVRQLNRRRAVVALARWRTGDALTNLRVTDVTGTSTIIDPASVDWAGFPPPSSELGG